MPQCHKCEHYQEPSEACLKCRSKETYAYPHGIYVDSSRMPAGAEGETGHHVDRACPTTLSEDQEDALRKAMCSMFSLNQLELLMLQAIMNKKSLTDFAASIDEFSKKNQHCTRQHAYEIRKALLKKLPTFKDALVTNGQRKSFK